MAASESSSSRIVALLRGVNVGGRNKVPMAELRQLVGELGYGAVATHLQSGNVIFSAGNATPAQAATQIEEAIERRFGLRIAVVTRTATELGALVAANPLARVASDPSRQLVVFLSGPVDQRLLGEVDPADHLPDQFAAGEREIHVWAPAGVSETKLTYAFWEKCLGGVRATARNWRTVERLHAIAEARR